MTILKTVCVAAVAAAVLLPTHGFAESKPVVKEVSSQAKGASASSKPGLGAVIAIGAVNGKEILCAEKDVACIKKAQAQIKASKMQ